MEVQERVPMRRAATSMAGALSTALSVALAAVNPYRPTASSASDLREPMLRGMAACNGRETLRKACGQSRFRRTRRLTWAALPIERPTTRALWPCSLRDFALSTQVKSAPRSIGTSGSTMSPTLTRRPSTSIGLYRLHLHLNAVLRPARRSRDLAYATSSSRRAKSSRTWSETTER